MALEVSRLFKYTAIILATLSVLKFKREMHKVNVVAANATIASMPKTRDVKFVPIKIKEPKKVIEEPIRTPLDFSQYLKRSWSPRPKTQLARRSTGVICMSESMTHDESSSVAFFVKIGKTGSTTLLSLINAKLSKRNDYKVAILQAENTMKNHDEWRSTLNKAVMGPCPKVIIGHWRFIDFTEKGFANPKIFSLVRNPLERIQSWFYYMVNQQYALNVILKYLLSRKLSDLRQIASKA